MWSRRLFDDDPPWRDDDMARAGEEKRDRRYFCETLALNSLLHRAKLVDARERDVHERNAVLKRCAKRA
jgi:hypothetical protein